MDYKIRRATYKDLGTIIDWAAKEGWNPGLYDKKAFYSQDKKGYFVGTIDGKIISCISAVSYNKDFGFLGFYIVKPKYRGKGYGIKIWDKAMQHLPTQNIGLDGVVTQQENYKKSGFKLYYRNIRYEGHGLNKNYEDQKIKRLSKIPFKDILKYDTQVFPSPRKKFLEKWIRQPNSLALGYVEKGKLSGYGMVRKCRKGLKVGPLFADSFKIAESIFLQLLNFAGKNNSVFLDVPQLNKKAIDLAVKYKMKPIFETARMYTKEKPKIDLNKVFGVTTFEVG
jgi:ribosomal protein S18 acetylase RimI-like enzyme